MAEEGETVHLKDVLKSLFEVFPFADLQMMMGQMRDLMDCEDTALMAEAVRNNLQLLREKEASLSKEGTNQDKSFLDAYMDNPDNFSQAQWEAIQNTRKMLRAYQRQVDFAVESGHIKTATVDPFKKKPVAKAKPLKDRRSKHKKWIQL